MKSIKSLLLFLIFFSSIYSQTDTINNNIDLQKLIEESTTEEENSQLNDIIENQINNPVDINSATINDLLQIPFLNVITAKAIIDFRNSKGNFKSIEELKSVEQLDQQTIDKIKPFIKVENNIYNLKHSLKDLITNSKIYFRFRAINNLQTSKGFYENKYLGSKQKIYNRVFINSNNKFRAGILFEKDAGEKSFSDFYSFHFYLNRLSIFSNILIGDYIIEFGEGLALWSSYSFSRSADAVNFINKNNGNIKPYVSTNENRFMRGYAFNIDLNHFRVSHFFSNNYYDASIDSTTKKINSLIYDGYHRTENELLRKNNCKERLLGLSSEYLFNNYNKIGLLYYHSEFSHEFNENTFYNSSKSKNYFSLTYSSLVKKINIAGEFTYHNSLVAFINNIFINVSKNISLMFSYRNYPKNFVSIHGYSFGEKPYVQNEIGFYSGIKLITKYGSFNIYYDQFKYPEFNRHILFPLKGYEFLLLYNHKLSRKIEISFKYKFKKKDYKYPVNNIIEVKPNNYNNLRFESLFNLHQKLRLRTRIEYVSLYNEEGFTNENGLLLFEDLYCQLNKNFQIYSRIIFFKSDSYESRLYEYENDLPGLTSIPALYGEGMRWYLMLKYNTNYGLSFCLKYSELFKPNEKNLGSGYNQINKNINNDLAFQIDFKF